MLTPISRTVGATQLVDEFLFSFTHTTEIDWMLPGVAPTGKRVVIPMVGVIKFRGAKLCHEHLYWDQASVLVQIGLLDPKLLCGIGTQAAGRVAAVQHPDGSLEGKHGEVIDLLHGPTYAAPQPGGLRPAA